MAIKGLDQAIDNLSRVRKNAIPAASAMTINRVPVPYGEMLVGSRRISQDISTRDEGGGGKVVVIGRQG